MTGRPPSAVVLRWSRSGEPIDRGQWSLRDTRLTLTSSAVSATCGEGAQLALGSVEGIAGYSPWTEAAPVNAVNSTATDGCPIEAPDGESLHLMSTRGGGGDQDIWVATRQHGGEFGTPQMLPAPVNSDANDFCPTPLRGKSLLFVSNRGGTDAYGTRACGGGDLYLTRRSPATGSWAAPRNLGCSAQGGPNGPGTEFGPSVVETSEGTLLFFSTGGAPGSSTQDIVMSRLLSDGFGPASLVPELNTPNDDDMMPNVRKDGLEVVFASTRPGGRGGFDIWSSSRSRVSDPWSPPVNLGGQVNGPGPETRPSLSWHGTRLYLGRSGDIYVSNR